MTRKHNPLVALAALILLVTILVLACTGCASESQLETYKNSDRFTVERYYYGGPNMPDCYIITDNETGAQYLYCTTNRAAGLTVLQTEEG